MVANNVRAGMIELEQGQLYWRHEAPSQSPAHARPTLLFIHAGVADHTLWNAQVVYCLDKGWSCLCYDIFGYGKSVPSEIYLQSTTRNPVDHVDLIDQLVTEVLSPDSKVIPVGLSIGGGLALSYTVFYPDRVAGMATIAGAVRGVDIPNTVEENALFERADQLLASGDVQGAAEMQVRIWRDGPLQPPGRMVRHLRERMLAWNLEIAARDVAGKGAGAVEAMRREPAPAMKLGEIGVPVAVAYGTLDETETIGAMKFLGQMIGGTEVRGFEAAHMVNLEREGEFNEWLGGWLDRHFGVE